VRAQQGRLDEAVTEMELLMALPDIRIGVSEGTVPEADPFRGIKSQQRKGEEKHSSPSSSSGNGTMHSDSLRLTDDDRLEFLYVCMYIYIYIYIYLLCYLI
jgi:hypothetical protein